MKAITRKADVKVTKLNTGWEDTVTDNLRADLSDLTHLGSLPVHHIHVMVHHLPDPSVDRPFVACVTLQSDGHPLCARAAAPTAEEAASLLTDRIRTQLERLNRHRLWKQRRAGGRAPTGRRHATSK